MLVKVNNKLINSKPFQTAKTALLTQGGFEHIQEGKLIELSLVLTGGLGLLLTLQAGADVMLALLNFSDNALLGTATLETAQSALQRFVFLNANFRHGCPSSHGIRLFPGCVQGLIVRLEYYSPTFPNCQERFQ